MDKYELWFIVAKVSNATKNYLIAKYNNEENIYNNINDIKLDFNIKNKEYEKLNSTTLAQGYKLAEYLNEQGIEYVVITDKKYPNKLRNISDPPYVLFYKGDLNLMYDDMIAIVGSRRNTSYGEQVTKMLVKELSDINYGVISGVAYGIDSIAHKYMLMKKGKTIGVLGCGIDVIYPKVNRALYEDIKNNGLLLSEFLPGTQPFAYNFPQRNRIISGLSCGVIVIEANEKSGSLITVGYAAEQGRDVMAVPGPIFNMNSKGCNRLIEDGVKAFVEIDDLYTFLNTTKKETIKKGNNVKYNEVLQVISDEPIHIDKIIENVKVDRRALFELLFEMQNKNEIICLPGNYYAKIS